MSGADCTRYVSNELVLLTQTQEILLIKKFRVSINLSDASCS